MGNEKPTEKNQPPLNVASFEEIVNELAFRLGLADFAPQERARQFVAVAQALALATTQSEPFTARELLGAATNSFPEYFRAVAIASAKKEEPKEEKPKEKKVGLPDVN